MKRCICLHVLLLFFLSLSVSNAAVRRVKADSPGPTYDGQSWATAFHTLGSAISAASSGDEIWVAAGVYQEKITLKVGVKLYGGFAGTETSRDSRQPKAYVTTIDANAQSGNVIKVQSGAASSNTVIDGFTIRNCYPGGAVNQMNGICCESASPTISNNTIINNGNGIYADGCSPVILSNNIRSNAGWAGVYCSNSSAVVANNLIAENPGIGVYLVSSPVTLTNNSIVGNQGATGGEGVLAISSNANLANNIVALNRWGVHSSSSSLTVRNNCVYGNWSANYVGLPDQTGLNGNISADPKFADGLHDLHIQPDSPCRNAGYNSAVQSGWKDIDGQARIQPTGGKVDIGADESDGTLWIFVAPVIIDPNGGTFEDAVDVTLSCATAGAAVHYRTDGVDPTQLDSSVAAGEAIHLDHSAILRARAYKDGCVPSDIASATFTVASRCATPTFTPSSGTYQSFVDVRIECATEGALVYYTLDGSEPGYSCVAVPTPVDVHIFRSCTLKAKAVKAGLLDSHTRGASYTILPPPRIYVKKSASGPYNDGLTWDTAYKSIGDATRAAGPGTEVWVAADTYGQAAVFVPVRLLGGFAGNETAAEQRQPERNITTINGGVVFDGVTSGSVLIDGFTIVNGYGYNGGAVSGPDGVDVTVSNNVFRSNNARFRGGAVYHVSQVLNNVFENNSAPHHGGAISECNIVSGNLIKGNTAPYGGGLDAWLVGCVVENNIFVGNSAQCGGAIFNSTCAVVPMMCNVFIYNTASEAGGVVSSGRGLDMENNIIAHNSSGAEFSGVPYLRHNCIFDNGSGTFVSGQPDPPASDGNIWVDPMLADPARGDLHLLPGSPCIDTGRDVDYWCTNDFDGNPRPRDGNGDGFAQWDIGCYEAPADYKSVLEAKSVATGKPAGLTNAVVTAVLPGRFYLETPSRTCGIGVIGTVSGTGKTVTVEGALDTRDGESVLVASNIVENLPAVVPSPLVVTLDALGGGPCGLQAGVCDWRPTPERQLRTSRGLSNIGMLVKVWGTVTSPGAGFFYLSGGLFDDGNPLVQGVRVDWPFDGAAMPSEGSRIMLTAISGCRIVHDAQAGDVVVRMLRSVSAYCWTPN